MRQLNQKEKFEHEMSEGYSFQGESILLGAAMYSGVAVKDLHVRAPLSMFNRHGLIAGATGTGKTKTLQVLVEGLSQSGIPSMVMDIKGDLSGLAASGISHPKIYIRHEQIGDDWHPSSFPVEFLSLSNEKGVQLRATISEFGPILLSKILSLNDTQQGIVAIAFKYCDDHKLPLLDIKDFRAALQFISNEAKHEIKKAYGLVSSSTVGAIMRRLLQLEQQGGNIFFGELSTEVEDLVRRDPTGRGIINILRLVDMQSKPQLFSTFMLCLLAEMYEKFPESGDSDKPRFVLFIDEAHLIFKEASKELLQQIETIVKLIRSKGVGIFFCTQMPTDVPPEILGQLGFKIQHSLRAFTAKDRKAIKQAAENYPLTEFYDTAESLTNLGIGEALITILNEKGIPSPLVHTLLRAPYSRMHVLAEHEIDVAVANSLLASKYNVKIDRESAYELLNNKIAKASLGADEKNTKNGELKKRSHRKSTFESILHSSIGRTIVREITRGIFDVLRFRK